MKHSRKTLLSLLVLILAGLILFLPDQEKDRGKVSEPATIVEVTDENAIDEQSGFGLLILEEGSEKGYGMIGVESDNTLGFGKLIIGSSETDSAFNSRILVEYGTSPIRVVNKSGFRFAKLEDHSLYMENVGMSEVKGFNGHIDLALVLGEEGRLDSLIYLGSSETPSYLRKMETAGYFGQFSGLELDRAHTLDAVSGATISCVAVARAVNELYPVSLEVFPDQKSLRNANNFFVKAKLKKTWILNLALLVLMFLTMSLRRFRKKPVVLIVSAGSIIWLGFYLNSSFTFLLFIQAFAGRGLSVFTTVYILLILISAIWFNNSYCKYICPFGNAQRMILKISPLKKKNPVLNNRHLKLIRYIVGLFIITGYLAGLDILSRFELFPHLFGMELNMPMFWISITGILLSLRIPNLWCRALCPTGCVLDTINNLARSPAASTTRCDCGNYFDYQAIQ